MGGWWCVVEAWGTFHRSSLCCAHFFHEAVESFWYSERGTMKNVDVFAYRRVIGSALTLLALVVAVYVGHAAVGCPDVARVSLEEAARVPEGAVQGTRAQDFTLPDLSGEPVSLSDLRGCVVAIEFWASWCIPCWTSVGHLDALSRRHEDRGFVVLGISLDRSLEGIQAFLEGTGHPEIRVLWGSYAEAQRVARVYEIRAIPRTLVIDRSGVIRYAGHPGRITDELLAPLW